MLPNDSGGMEVFSFSTDRIEFKSEEDGDYIIGYVSTHDRDIVDDIVTKDCMVDMLDQLKAGHLKLDLEHETLRGGNNFDRKLNIAKVPLAVSVNGLYDGKGLMVKYKMNKNYKKLDPAGNAVYNYDEIKAMIKDGQLDAFSIAYIAEKTAEKNVDGVAARLLQKIRWINTALTGTPINATATMVSVMLKSLEAETKPFADYSSFADCVSKNKDKDDPEAYCATIMRNTEGKDVNAQGGDKNGGMVMNDAEKKALEVKAQEEAKAKADAEAKAREEAEKARKETEDLKSEIGKNAKALEEANKTIAELKAKLDKPVYTTGMGDTAAGKAVAEAKALEKIDPIQFI